MAHKIKSLLILCVLSMIAVSCASEKDKYFNRYNKFANYVLHNSETFSSMDWEAAIAQYDELRGEYRYHSMELTLDERQKIDQLNAKINARIIEQSTKDAVDNVSNFLNEVVNTINELSELE